MGRMNDLYIPRGMDRWKSVVHLFNVNRSRFVCLFRSRSRNKIWEDLFSTRDKCKQVPMNYTRNCEFWKKHDRSSNASRNISYMHQQTRNKQTKKCVKTSLIYFYPRSSSNFRLFFFLLDSRNNVNNCSTLTDLK